MESSNVKHARNILVAIGMAALAFIIYLEWNSGAPNDVGGGTHSASNTSGHVANGDGIDPHGAGAMPSNQDIGELKKSVRFAVGDVNVKSIYVDGPITWIGTSNGLIRFDSKTGQSYTYGNRNGLLSNGVFYVDKIDGELWVGTYGGGLSILNFESQEWRNYNIPDGMGDAFIYDAVKLSNGDVWLATWSGANRIVGGKLDDFKAWELFTVANTNDGLPNDWVYGLAEGTSGEVWFATEGGLARYVGGQWDNWQHADGLGAPFSEVEADMPFKNDPGTQSSHHARQKVEMGLTDINVAYNPNYIIALTVDNDGTVWAGTWGGGLSKFDGENWQSMTVNDGLPGNHVFSLAKDLNGDVWIGTSRGLAVMEGDSVRVIRPEDGLYSQTIFSMAFPENGAAWIGSYGDITWFPRGIDVQ